LVAAALADWSALLVHSFLDFNLHIPANAMLLFTLTGMALRRGPGEDAPHHWSTISLGRLRRPLSGSLLVLGFLYGALVLRTALSDFPYESTQARLDVQSTIESIHGLRDSLAIDPGNAQALLLLGDLRRVRAARAEQTDEMIFESQKALAAYQKALRANPLDDNIRVRMGMVYDLMQRYSEAYLCYQAAVAAQPYNGQFWSALGTHFLKRGLLARAEEAYRTAAKCPHGEKGAAESASKIGAILKQGDLLAPASPVDASAPTGEEPATAP
jgi:tetratricopeptide (TPR) repeat protein